MTVNEEFLERISRLENELSAIRERERELTYFVENASVGLHWLTTSGEIVWANQAELDLLGFSREDYIGRNIKDFHADPSAVEDILGRLKRKEKLENYEARLRTRDGAIVHVAITIVNTCCITRDITDRKRFEQRLLTQHGAGRILAGARSLDEAAGPLLKVICEHLFCRIGLLWNLEERELRVTRWFESSSNGNGCFGDESRSLRFTQGIGLPGRMWATKAPAWIGNLESDGNFPRLRLAAAHELRSAFGFPILLDGEVCAVMEFFTDDPRLPDRDILNMMSSLGYQIGEFLERIQAQDRLADREESYRVLAETASDGIVTIDESSTIRFANSAAAEMFGYSVQELAGSPLTRLMPERLRDQYRAAMSRYVATGEKGLSWQAIPVTGEHRDGHEMPLEVSFGEYRQGSKHLFVGVMRDVTQRKLTDNQLRQSAKLESLGVLAGGIAHDFNNLLTGILGNVSLALDGLPADDPAKSLLQNAIEASERAAHLTKQLLAYAGKGRFVIEPIDVSNVVGQISTLLHSFIPKNVVLRLNLEQPLPLVEADVAQIQQLIMNLVINAAEAIPAERQGVVLITTKSVDVDARYVAQTLSGQGLPPGRYIAVNVHDNGTGMDEATLGKIFDPFFTTKFTGRGLGLAAALGIVEGHKGGLRVFSTPGQGTTFRILLPVTARTPRLVGPAESRKGSTAKGAVLVVDDEPVVRKTAVSSLERYGYTAPTAENGRQGVEAFQRLHKQLVAVILDMTMPVMDGEEALAEIRRIDPSVPVILSSGFNEVEAIRRFTGKGLAGFIQKPYTAAVLAQKLEAVLRAKR
jgi:PAS domain S-box-containing protein